MKLSILIPVYNEGGTIDRVLGSIAAAVLPAGIEREMVVINEGSTDRTEAELEGFRQAHRELALVYHHERVNHGTGGCLRQGIAIATGDLIGIQDANLDHDFSHHAVRQGLPLQEGTDERCMTHASDGEECGSLLAAVGSAGGDDVPRWRADTSFKSCSLAAARLTAIKSCFAIK